MKAWEAYFIKAQTVLKTLIWGGISNYFRTFHMNDPVWIRNINYPASGKMWPVYHKKIALPHLTFGNTNLRCCFIWSAAQLRQILILFSFEAQISGGTRWWSLINQLIYSIFRPKHLVSTVWMCWTSSSLNPPEWPRDIQDKTKNLSLPSSTNCRLIYIYIRHDKSYLYLHKTWQIPLSSRERKLSSFIKMFCEQNSCCCCTVVRWKMMMLKKGDDWDIGERLLLT